MIFLQLAKSAHVAQWLSLVNENRAVLERWLPYLKQLQTLEDAQQYIQFNKHLDFYLGACIYEIWVNQTLVGQVVLHNGRYRTKSVEIGYWLGVHYRGHKWASQACYALINKVFIEQDIQTIQLHCSNNNIASQKVALQLGFQLHEATATLHEYHLAREDWWLEYDTEGYLRYFESSP